MSTKLFIGRLSYDTTDAQLAEHFAQAGSVVSAKVITDKYSGQGKGFGFVEMSTPQEAENAIKQLNNTMLAGRSIVVNQARPQEERNGSNSNKRPNRW